MLQNNQSLERRSPIIPHQVITISVMLLNLRLKIKITICETEERVSEIAYNRYNYSERLKGKNKQKIIIFRPSFIPEFKSLSQSTRYSYRGNTLIRRPFFLPFMYKPVLWSQNIKMAQQKKRKQQQGPHTGGLTPHHLRCDCHQFVPLHGNMILRDIHPQKPAISL